MQKFYSEQLAEAIKLLYFQTDASLYPKAVPLLEKAAAANEPDAFYVLARCYAWGDSGLPDSKENDKKALELSKRGAELGSALAILGADRFGKLGAIKPQMKMTHEEAFAAAIKMADSGNPLAMYAVGLVYFWGDVNRLPAYKLPTPEANALESLKWFDRAAEQGFVPGFRNGYLSRRQGENRVPKDLGAALTFVERVQDRCAIPSVLYSNIGNDYDTFGQKDKMIYWYQRGVEAGENLCMNNLAYSYEHGDGVKQDNKLAYKYYKMAFDAGYAPAAKSLERVKKPSFWESLLKR